MTIPSTVFLPQPFANNASGPYINPIPDTGGVGPAATWNLGFPPITMQEEVSGGKPPLGQDFNGILNALSTHVFAQQAGQLYRYSSAVSTAIGGYPIGSVLESTDGATVWFSVIAANTNDPDANGAGWVPLFNYGYTTKTGLTGGVVTLTRLEARRGVIILAGALVANLQVVVPNTFQTWLIVNTTSGAFTTTVKTAAGTGVTIPQGGYQAPTGVFGDGVNIYPTVAPVNLPIDQAPTPLTIAQRTNAGYLLATYFNQNSGLENPSVGSVIVQNAAADGYFRKIGITDFEAQLLLQNIGGGLINGQVPLGVITQWYASLLLQNFGGAVSAAQVPVGAVTQYASNILALANLGTVGIQTGTFTATGNISGQGSVASTGTWTKIPGSAQVMLAIEEQNIGGGSSGSYTISGLPSAAFPAQNVRFVTNGIAGGSTNQNDTSVVIDTSGGISVFNGLNTGSATGLSGVRHLSVVYEGV